MTLYPSTVSIVLIYSAMAIYSIALVAFTLDLARRAAPINTSVMNQVSFASRTSAGQSGAIPSPATTVVRETAEHPALTMRTSSDSRWGRIAVALTVLAWLIHLSGVVLRGVAAHRVPWANMYEFSITSTVIIVGVFLLMQIRLNIRYLGTFVVGLMLVLLGVGSV